MAGKTSPQLRKQFTDLVVYKDAIVAIKKLNDTFNMTDILKKEKQELKSMMILDHRYEFLVDQFLNENISEILRYFMVCYLTKAIISYYKNMAFVEVLKIYFQVKFS